MSGRTVPTDNRPAADAGIEIIFIISLAHDTIHSYFTGAETPSSFLSTITSRKGLSMSLVKEFKEFAMKGNVVDMAVGIIIGGAFGKIITSLVNDVIMPPIGMLLGGADFKGMLIPLKQSAPGVVDVAIKYGAFINTVIDFTMVAAAIFLLVKGMNTMRKQPAPPAPSTKKCPECQMEIPLAAKRCGHCTSVVQ